MPEISKFSWRNLDLFSECRELRWWIWQCPPFLFLIMGTVTIISMVATYILSSRYIDEPEIAALIVASVAVIFFVISFAIIRGFNRIAEINRMKSEFISIVSHQLRSPLSIFKWTLDVLERQIKKETAAQNPGLGHSTLETNSVQTLRITTEYMISLVNSLLEVSRIEARTFVLKTEVFPLLQLTREIVENFKKYAEASHITIHIEHDSNLPDLSGDRERTGIVVQNLIDNAIRYTAASGDISIKIVLDNGKVLWSIKDQGIGIPVKEQKFIFQKFFRAGNIRKSYVQTRGSGIGLYIAKQIVEASRGEIGFRSEEGKGSVFWFSLPIGTIKKTTGG